jgi:type VII secretion protein EccE
MKYTIKQTYSRLPSDGEDTPVKLRTSKVFGSGVDAAVPAGPMKAQRTLGLTLSWPSITSAFLFDVAVLIVACHLPSTRHTVAFWYGVAVAAVVTALALPTYRGITVASALARWVREWSAPEMTDSHDTAATLCRGCADAVDHRRRFGRDVVGVREYQGQLVSVIAVDGSADASSGRHQLQTVSPSPVPVPVVAAALRQFDVRLEAIDIVSVRKRPAPDAGDPSAPITVDDHAAAIEHGTWLVLRMDPQQNVAAIAARDSVASTLAAVTERLAGDLDGHRCVARPLVADELPKVDTAIAAGLQPDSVRPGWSHLKHFGGYATSFWVSPRDITSETLDHLWLHDTDATVVTIRLTATADKAEVSAWVRFHSEDRLGKDVTAGLNRLTGRQLAAVQASLPAPARRPALAVPARALHEDEQLAVRVGPIPVGAAPQHSMPG